MPVKEVSPEMMAAENATIAIQTAMSAANLNQIAIGRMFRNAVKAGYPKLLGYDSVKDYAAKRLDWAYSTIAQFVTVANVGELAGWSDEQLLTVGVNGRSISALMRIGAIVKFCGKDDAEKSITLNKLLTKCVGKSLDKVVAECNKINPNGKGKVLAAITPKPASGESETDGDSGENGETEEMVSLTLTGDVAAGFLSYMETNGITDKEAFFAELLAKLTAVPTIPVITNDDVKPAKTGRVKTVAVAVN